MDYCPPTYVTIGYESRGKHNGFPNEKI